MLSVLQHLVIADPAGHDDVVQESVNLPHLILTDHVLKILTGGEVIGVHLRDPVVLTPRMEEQVLLEDVLHVPRLCRLRGVVHVTAEPHCGNEVMKSPLPAGAFTDSGTLNTWVLYHVEEPVKFHVTYAELLRPVTEVRLLFHVIPNSRAHGQQQVQDLMQLQ